MGKKKDRLILELSDYADISIEEGSKVTDYLNENYVLEKKKEKKSKRFINKIKELYHKDTVDYYLNNEKKGRYGFVDVAKAIAMIFIFIGHYLTSNIGPFAYSFHLFLFFMASGFFALHMQKDNFFDLIKKLFLRLVIPLFIWSIIAFIVVNLANNNIITKNTIFDFLLNPSDIRPNYWFMPALFSITIIYWLLAKIVKKPWLIVLITFILFLFLGQTKYIFNHNLEILENVPLARWIDPKNFLTYGFWYALGAAAFPLIIKFIENLNSESLKKRLPVKILSYFCIAVSIVLLLHKSNFNIIPKNRYIVSNFIILKGLIIITAVLFFSNILSNSKVLNKIGKHTMIYVGIEFIIRDLIGVTVMQSLNLGVINLYNHIGVVMYSLLNVYLVYKLIDPIDNYFPILNGKLKKG